jgi:hypothetical protein
MFDYHQHVDGNAGHGVNNFRVIAQITVTW